jgi:hypothetical protein
MPGMFEHQESKDSEGEENLAGPVSRTKQSLPGFPHGCQWETLHVEIVAR